MKLFLSCLLTFYSIQLLAQSTSWFQQRADFDIKVTLNVQENMLEGFEKITYHNQSPDTLHFIRMHLWPNAYKNDRTAFSEQMLRLGNTAFYFSSEEERGYINRLDFKANGQPARLITDSQWIDVATLILPQPLMPGDSVTLTTPFHIKLPFAFSRSGYWEDTYQITQWFPRPAVYDANGWHAMPYLQQGEFYYDFGHYRVAITLPDGYTVAATGRLVNEDNIVFPGPKVQNIAPKKFPGNNKGFFTDKKQDDDEQNISGKNQTWIFEAENVPDFAWFAQQQFSVHRDTLQLPSGRRVQLSSYYSPDKKELWQYSLQYLKEALRERGKLLGEYPYDNARIVAAHMGIAGGMEYPTIMAISGIEDTNSLETTIAHEAGHFWLYGILATNERKYPWMDEGLNTYLDYRFGDQPKKDRISIFKNKLPDNAFDLLYQWQLSEKKDQPINTPSNQFSDWNYAAIAYHKTALWAEQLEKGLGTAPFDKGLKEYYQQWKFRHPGPYDFKMSLENASGKKLDSLFLLLYQNGPLETSAKKDWKINFLFNLRNTSKVNYLFWAPSIGYNHYDKLMAGLLLHNYTIPVPKFHFLLAPMYATGSKQIVGLGRTGYSFTSYGKIRKTDIGLSVAHFNMDAYTDSTGKKNFMAFTKLAPYIRLTFRNKDPRSKVHQYVQWKTYLIRESSLLFTYDSIEDKTIITYPKHDRYLNQLQWVYENARALYPYAGRLKIEQARHFVRLAAEGKYFFNYANGGGLQVRVFAGKFIYLGDVTPYKRFITDRYHLNMTGPNGYEDYTYSNYFIGRNEFNGWASQQIMMRDGGFKVQSELLASKIGKTDDWLAALNLTTKIPDGINPLSVIPLDIDLNAFLDIGTYAEAWKDQPPSGKFLFDAGLQLSMFKGIVNIYAPLLYSKAYRDYIKSTIPKKGRFWNTITFSIDIQNLRLKQFFGLE